MTFFQIVKHKHHTTSHNAWPPDVYKNISSISLKCTFCATGWGNVINNGWIDCKLRNVSVLVTNQRVPTAVVIHPHGTHQHCFQLQLAGVFSGKQKPSNQCTLSSLTENCRPINVWDLLVNIVEPNVSLKMEGTKTRANRRESHQKPEKWSKIPTGADVTSAFSYSCPYSLMCALFEVVLERTLFNLKTSLH